ncbi:GNAT family N-acetyltransferase [uncultured Algimonas sp.]|uniref:GNAT family N-acetyltransferase n=1 Tax=uncultured Algimonas sp. TaxID=1547920 RepID=UPI0026042026|nr:GNAT family N-acetyltransferase [uncultured Algimonas sp.]
MTDITFTVQDTETKGRIVAHVPGHDDTAEITFSKSSPTLVIVDHTGVPDSMSGEGVGLALVERMVGLARERGYKTVPLCPFYKAMIARHPDWADVIP